MKTLSSRLASVLAMALVCALLLLPQTSSRVAIAREDPRPEPENIDALFEHTALGVVLRANCNEIPRTGEDLVRVLSQVGDFAQLPIPFSAVSMSSGLTHPRVILAPRIGQGPTESVPVLEVPNAPGVALPALPGAIAPFPLKPGMRTVATPRPISTAGLTQPNLEGRLFLAANMEKIAPGDIRVKTVEFLSWNSRKKRFDFGVIDYENAEPEIKLLDGVRCMSCHKNRGPILGLGPWSNTTNNDVIRAAATLALKLPKAPKGVAGEDADQKNPTDTLKAQTTFDGMSLVIGEPEAVDAAVRLGSDLVSDRAIHRAMLRSVDGRKAFVYLLTAIADPLPIDQSYQKVKQPLDLTFNTNSANFADEVVTILKTSSSILSDYSPAGSFGTLQTTRGRPAAWGRGSAQPTNTQLVWSGNTTKVMAYDSRRQAGEPAMAGPRQPSNPRAFFRPPVGVPPRPSAAVSAASLARVIGLTEGDRAFISETLADVARRLNRPKVTAATLAREVFTGATFSEMLKAGDLPDREEFKDRFLMGVAEVARGYQLSELFNLDRRSYASGPNSATNAGQEEPELVPTTACLRCHDVRGVGKPAFNPIPKLAFDPFDKKSREAWVSNADPKSKVLILDRMVRRLVTDKDMPPEDSAEHDLFRAKDPTAFENVKEFLERELKQAKGN